MFNDGGIFTFSAAVKIDTIAYMPAQEFGNAYSLFVSQNYGACKKERIKAGRKISFAAFAVFCALISAVIFVFAKDLMCLFVDADKIMIIAEGARYVGIGIPFLWYGYFRGIKKPNRSLLLTVISLGTRVLLYYTLAPNTGFGVVAIWVSIPVGWFLADIAGYIFYRSNNSVKWK